MPLPLSLPMKGGDGIGCDDQIIRDDGLCDDIACQHFSSYDKAYAVLERYSGISPAPMIAWLTGSRRSIRIRAEVERPVHLAPCIAPAACQWHRQ